MFKTIEQKGYDYGVLLQDIKKSALSCKIIPHRDTKNYKKFCRGYNKGFIVGIENKRQTHRRLLIDKHGLDAVIEMERQYC